MAKISKSTVDKARRDERAAIKDAKAAGPKPGTPTADAYQNFMQSIGYGTNNALSSSTYGFNPITRVRTQLEWIYRGSWFGKILIDIAADDMTRGGIELQAKIPPEDIETVQQSMVRQGVWPSLNEAVKWGDLYGGAIALIMIDGQDPRTPLNIERVGKDSFKGLLVFDRWMVEPDLNDLVTDMGPEIGMPKYYRVTTDAPAFRMKSLHHSRCIRFEGLRLPYWQRVTENLWGVSVFEPIYDRMVAVDSATMGMAQLVYKAFIRTYAIKNMRRLLSEGGTDGEAALVRQIEMMRRLQGNEGITLIDEEDRFEGMQQTTFRGVGDAVLQLIQQIAGFRQMPLTRMLGQSPAGLNSTGESDLRTYYDGIIQQQEFKMRMGMTKVIHVTAKSEGIKLPEEATFQFRPLWQLSETEKSEVFARDATAIGDLESGGLIAPQTALKELRQLRYTTGRMSNITDQQIDEAEDKPAPPIDPLGMENAGMGLDPEGGAEGGPKLPKDTPTKEPDKLKVGDSGGMGEFCGIPIIIQARAGERRWKDGPVMPCDYGFIRFVASAEGEFEWMDVFLGTDGRSDLALVIDMLDPATGRFEEHKVMLGFSSHDAAFIAFAQSYPEGRKRIMGAKVMSIDELKAWLASADVTLPVSAGLSAA